MDKKEKILNAFKETGKPMRPGEIAEKTGIDSKEVSKLIKELKTDEKVYSPKRCYYDIKK
ncbi:MAG: winged helix-turn-helix transcriptional regulator [Chlorobi bacterium]|nr:winged helix-turn-helix transcriptional regulator [Chlorobiota bacterium]